MKQLRVAILGQGRSGRDIHGKYLVTDTERFRITAVADPIENRRKRAEEEYGCETFKDYSELLDRKDIDLVINSTPSHMHVPVSLEFIKRGFDVLCEKPVSGSVKALDTLIEASEKAGTVFTVFQQSRYAPYFRQVKKIIDSGVLGRIIQISIAFAGFSRRWDWQSLQACNGGNLLNTGPHPLDQALRLLNTDKMPDVTCYMDRANTFGDAEDYVKLLLHAKDRPVIDIEVTSCNAYPCYTYSVQAVRGSVKGSMTHIDWKYYIDTELPRQELIREPLNKDDMTPAYCTEKIDWHDESWDVPDEDSDLFMSMSSRFYSMLYDTIVCGTVLEVTPRQVRQQIAVIEEARRQNSFIIPTGV
jgi:scyllo-inositol 2-dehydrogenase (NADP+)